MEPPSSWTLLTSSIAVSRTADVEGTWSFLVEAGVIVESERSLAALRDAIARVVEEGPITGPSSAWRIGQYLVESHVTTERASTPDPDGEIARALKSGHPTTQPPPLNAGERFTIGGIALGFALIFVLLGAVFLQDEPGRKFAELRDTFWEGDPIPNGIVALLAAGVYLLAFGTSMLGLVTALRGRRTRFAKWFLENAFDYEGREVGPEPTSVTHPIWVEAVTILGIGFVLIVLGSIGCLWFRQLDTGRFVSIGLIGLGMGIALASTRPFIRWLGKQNTHVSTLFGVLILLGLLLILPIVALLN